MCDENDYNTLEYSTKITNVNIRNKRSMAKSVEKDKTYTLTKHNVKFGNFFYKNVQLKFYLSSGLGNEIVHAQSGVGMHYRIGSLLENILFRIINTNVPYLNEPAYMYYNSPEEYETHAMITIDDNIKNAWRQKQQRYNINFLMPEIADDFIIVKS